MTYRIIRVGKYKYICQARRSIFGIIWYWSNMFCGPWSDLPKEFSSAEEARNKLLEFAGEDNYSGMREVVEEINL